MAPGALALDTTGMSLDEVVERIAQLVHEALMKRSKVAVLGYPNVGKSTLVNRLSGTREAVVHEQAGVTRDRKEVEADWNGRAFTLVDTGGVDLAGRARAGRRDPPPGARRRSPTPSWRCSWSTRAPGCAPATPSWPRSCAAGRCRRSWSRTRSTSGAQQGLASEFYALGLGDPMPVSATQGLGTGDLLDLIVQRAARRRGRGRGRRPGWR